MSKRNGLYRGVFICPAFQPLVGHLYCFQHCVRQNASVWEDAALYRVARKQNKEGAERLRPRFSPEGKLPRTHPSQ